MSRMLPAVLDSRLDAAEAAFVTERRSLTARLGTLRGRSGARVVGAVYWPIAIVHARASSTGRRQWTERTVGAIDLVSGRIGIVDEEVPRRSEVVVDHGTVIPPRLGRDQALADWRDYFRDYVDRRRHPLRPPGLSVERVEPVWVEQQVVEHGGHRFLVDPVTHRADPLEGFPWVEQHLTISDPDPNPTHTTKEHTCMA